MIIRQVEELKGLVNEFSSFARLPAANLAPADISQIIMEALSLYREAHKDIKLIFEDSKNVPVFKTASRQSKYLISQLTYFLCYCSPALLGLSAVCCLKRKLSCS